MKAYLRHNCFLHSSWINRVPSRDKSHVCLGPRLDLCAVSPSREKNQPSSNCVSSWIYGETHFLVHLPHFMIHIGQCDCGGKSKSMEISRANVFDNDFSDQISSVHCFHIWIQTRKFPCEGDWRGALLKEREEEKTKRIWLLWKSLLNRGFCPGKCWLWLLSSGGQCSLSADPSTGIPGWKTRWENPRLCLDI